MDMNRINRAGEGFGPGPAIAAFVLISALGLAWGGMIANANGIYFFTDPPTRN